MPRTRSIRQRGGRSEKKGTPLPYRLALIVLAVSILVVPLIFVPGATDNFRLPKELANESLALLSIALLALGARRLDIRRLGRSPAFQAVLPLVVVAALGIFFTGHPGRAIEGVATLAIGAAALVGWSLAVDGPGRRRLLLATLVPATLLALFAVLQFHRLYEPFEFAGQVTRRLGLTSLAGGAFDLASYLLFPLLIVQVIWWRTARLWQRWFLAVFFLLGLYALLATQTFTVFLAFFAGSLVINTLRPPPRRVVLGVILALTAGASISLHAGPLVERLELKLAYLDDANHLLTGRLDGWRAAWWMLGEHPLTGVGQGVYGNEFANTKLELAAAGTPFYAYHTDAHFVSAHNELLEVAAECGWPGLLALVWGLGIFGHALGRRVAEMRQATPEATPEEADESVLAAGYFSAMLVLALFNFPFHLAIVAYPALLLASGVLASAPRDGGGWSSLVVRGLVVAILTLAWGLHYRQGERQLRADRILAEVEAMTQQASQLGRLPEKLASRNLYRLREAARLDGTRIGIPVAQGWQYLLRGRNAAAVETFEDALKAEPRAEIYANLGQARLAEGNRQAASQAFRRAILLDPQMSKELERQLDELGLRLGVP